jgi:ribonucleoside-diphosphate reductase alpha chain
MFLDDTACNLASINLVKFLGPDGGFDVEGFRHACRLWTMVLEISVLMAAYPSPVIAQKSWDFRTLGLGYANMGTVLMRSGIPYDSVRGGGHLRRHHRHHARRGLCHLGGDGQGSRPLPRLRQEPPPHAARHSQSPRAAYNAAPGDYENLSITPKGIDPTHCPQRLLQAARETWDRALELGQAHGFRNAQVTVLAPTGTIGLVMDCDTTGIEPDFALVKFKKLAGGGYSRSSTRACPWLSPP